MKSTKHVLLLIIPLCLIFGYSASDLTISLGNSELEKHEWIVKIREDLESKPQKIVQVSQKNRDEANETQLISSAEKTKKIKDKILVIGDSMAQGLEPHFKKLSLENNISIITRFKIGSSSFYWSGDENLTQEIEKFHPDVVLIVLGANEWIASSNPKLKRAIKKLTSNIALTNTEYVWIGPPINEAKEYYQMLRDTTNPKFVYDYTELNVTRAKDKIHPNSKGFSQWSKMIFLKLSQDEQNVSY